MTTRLAWGETEGYFVQQGDIMAGVSIGQPFGMDASALATIDWDLALKRVVHDQRSDFIYAPHLGFIYRKGGQELIDALGKELKTGAFSPGVSHVGAGMGLKFPPIATVPLSSAQIEAAVEVNQDAQPTEEAPLSIAEAKRRLALALGVTPANIKITVEA